MKSRKQSFKLFLFVLPALVMFSVFFLVPVFRSLFLSFTDTYGVKETFRLVGLENYRDALKDPLYIKSIGTTLKFVVVHVTLVNIFGLSIALLLDTKFKGRNVLRTTFFLPQIMSLLIVGYLWSFLFTQVNITLEQFLRFPESWHISWLGNTKLSMISVALTSVWQGVGYYMIIYLAALQSISDEYLEAAQVDGASRRQITWKIKIPLLSPTIILCTILGVSYSLKAFDLPFAMTSGGPNHSSTTMVMRIYFELTKSWRYGYASAESVILFLIIAAATFALNRYMKKLEDAI